MADLLMSLPPQTTSASPAASGLEIFSTGSEPPRMRSHESRSHALHRAQRHHQRHGFSCCSTSLPASQLLRSTASFCAWRRPVPGRPTLSRNSRSNWLDFQDLKAQLGSLFLEQFHLLAAVSILVILHPFINVL